MARIGTRNVMLAIDDIDYSDAINKATITSKTDSDAFLSFEAASAGGARAYQLEMTAAQDAETGSLWDLMWNSAGQELPFYLAPYGNDVASTSQPHYSGTVVVSEPDGDLLGGQSNISTTAVFTVDLAWDLVDRPTKITSGTFPFDGS